ncbi:MAG: 23S rRNA (uracil(1939)-C(5))-methyltransferase RlmD [Bacteroidales bacterium]|jgi:23S rRNA (uracil1939-C5)-methyltransferase|nr:23S rRNA (uracil(1939)-C(5))-methyltransferase RlmD [Bacteroidales bacterium]
MSRKNKLRMVVENVPIVDIADDGRAVGKSDEWVIFVPHAVPGDVVDVRIFKKRKKYAEGSVIDIKSRSDLRTEPVCPEFSLCGGCKWQDFRYEQQLFYKHKNVSDCLIRIGKLDVPEIPPVLASSPTLYYRNKLEFTFSSKRWLTDDEIQSGEEVANPNALGFHIPGRFDKVLDIRHCSLQPDPSNAIRLAIKEFALSEKMPFFDLRTHEGFLRNLIIRTSSTGEVMVIICFYHENVTAREHLLNFVAERFPEISSLMYIINPKANDSFSDLDAHLYKGQSFITEEMEGLKFKIGAKSFYQTNSKQAYQLYRITRDFAKLTGTETVYDLYTGTGTIANFVAAQAKKVAGIEYVAEAIEDAMENSALNGICNTRFFAGDMKDVLNAEFIEQQGRPDVVILDPPRAGVHPKVIDALLAAAPRRIVYVSCNPASQARDLSLMQEHYAIKAVQPVDMFPHTHHVENIVMMERR